MRVCTMIGMASLRLILLSALALSAQVQTPLIIDTDAGSDDLMAITFLLSHPTLRIEAITTANGLAHVDAGARNIVRLLDLSGRKNVPVFAGRPTPLKGNAEFPAEWRKVSDDLPGVTLPITGRQSDAERPADYLAPPLHYPHHPAPILALGPLPTIAEPLQRAPSIAG